MVKSERLIHITLAVQHRAPVRIRRLANECGVTERTIYRDFHSLAALDVPIFNDQGKGYRLARKMEIKMGDITVTDADLVIFALYNNPLNGSPFFKRRISYIRELLQQEFEKKPRFDVESILLFESTFTRLSERHYGSVIKFLYSILHKSCISILHKDNFTKSEDLIPIGIRFKQDSAVFILYSEKAQCDVRIDAEDVQGISISSKRFVDRPFVDMNRIRLKGEVLPTSLMKKRISGESS